MSIETQIGIEFRESSYVIGPKCNRVISKDMIFSLSLGFQDIPDPKDNKKTYSLLLLDTIKTGQNGSAYLSDGMKTKNDVIFYFDAPEETKPSKKQTNGKEKKAAATSTRSNAIMKSKLRNENREQDQQAAEKRREHQRELAEARREAGLEKYSDPNDSKGMGEAKKAD